MRRLAVALLLSLPIACGLTFAPGDYREPGAAPAGDAALASGDGAQTTSEAGDAGPTATRIALFAGRRTALPGEPGMPPNLVGFAETILTSFTNDGKLGPITFDAPPPSNMPWVHALLSGGTIQLHSQSGLVRAPFSDHITGPWTSAAIPPLPEPGMKPWLLDEHGFLSSRSLSGAAKAWSAPFADVDGGIGAWAHVPAGATTVVRGNTTLVRGGDNVYVVGGNTEKDKNDKDGGAAAENHSEIEVAKLGADGSLGDFHLTTPLPPAGDAGTSATNTPIAVADAQHLFVLGGLTTTAATSLTNVACAAKIKDPATGDLDPWVVLPSLPSPLTAFAAVVTPQWLVVFGGQIGTGPADTRTTSSVLRLSIHADGTFGNSWEPAGDLPEGRSNLVAVTY